MAVFKKKKMFTKAVVDQIWPMDHSWLISAKLAFRDKIESVVCLFSKKFPQLKVKARVMEKRLPGVNGEILK